MRQRDEMELTLEAAGTVLSELVWICPIQYSITCQQTGEGPDPNPEPEPVAEPEPSPEPEPEPSPEPEPEPAPAVLDWRDRRIGTLTARLREEQRKNAELASAASASPSPELAGTLAEPTTTAAELDALVEQRSAERAAVSEFNRQCDSVAVAGRIEFGEAEFNSRVQSLVSLIDRGDPQDAVRYNQFLVAALETGEASKLLFSLGGNLNEAARIMALSPVKMAVELTRMSAKPSNELSAAPRPIRPISTGGARNHEPIDPGDPERADRLSTAEWMKRREQQIAARQGNGRARR